MGRAASITTAASLAFGLLALASGISGFAQTPQSSTSSFNQTYEAAFAKAREDCNTLWSDHIFDPLRSRLPLGEEKPTFSMLKNKEKLHSKDKPLADLAIKTVEKCRSAYAPVYNMLPEQVNAFIKGTEQRQDALIAELYNGKITFGDYNVEMNRLRGKFAEALSGISIQTQSNLTSARAASESAVQSKLPQPANPTAAVSNERRLALVIGNSNYANLPKLSNPTNDARSIADVLQKMGYSTHLLLDTSENGIRSAFRKFASESRNSDVGVIYYAGHAAQLKGNNYLLPIDIDLPRTEADIEFTGLNVANLVDSIGSNTKIVFLDACRDNPVLFKNIVSGRGGSPVGLAPASASNFNSAKPGGGIFIAFATEAGAVADDGHGQHSPFTQALLSYMQRPISIDDMFSLVTKEVRLVTKNMQRPFKYASLENIICLTPACLGAPTSSPGDIVQQAIQSEDEELQIALQTKNSVALETYLQKYPETKKRSELLNKIAALKRSELTEWTIYEVANQHIPQYIQLSSIQLFENRAAVKLKWLVDSSRPKVFYNGKALPDADYVEDLTVYDCAKPVMALAETSIFDKSGNLLFHYKWAEPQYLNLAIGTTLGPGSIGLVARNIACHAEVATPLINKKQLTEMKFTSLSSTASGDGELFFGPSLSSQNVQDQKEIVLITRFNSDRNVNEFFPQGISIPDPPNFRIEADHVLLKCNENKFLIDKIEFWSAAKELVRVQAINRELPFDFSEFKEFSPYAILQGIVCGKSFGGIGVVLTPDNDGSIRVTEVLSGSPAEKVGVKKDDVITHVNSESVSGLTLEQVIEKLRGPAHSKVDLTILRKGQDNPFEVGVDREIIEKLLTQGTSAK